MVRRHLWQAAGAVCLALGWLGMILPLMPGFVFLLMAVFCFARGNPRVEQWLRNHPQIGPPLADWHERGAIGRAAKIKAVALIGFGALVAALTVPWPLVLLPLVSMTLVAGWLWTRPE